MKSLREQFNQKVWTAFSRLIEKRYHRNIGFLPAMNADDIGKDFIFSKNGDLIVPLFAGEQFLGALKVKQGGALASEDISSIQEMFQKIGVALLDASDSLNREDIGDRSESKVIKKYLINLTGGGAEARHNLAINIHEKLGTWSLISWSDAKIETWTTTDSERLADTCVYIHDVFELSPKERQQLMTLASLPESIRPNIILGSYRPLSEYVNEQSLDKKLALLFTETSMNVDQMPKERLRLAEVLEMLFGESVSNISSFQSLI